MTDIGKPVSFIATANAAQALYFYETIIGLQCLDDDPYALVFDMGGITLRIQKVESIPEVNYTVLGWEVIDIRTRVESLAKKGVQFELFSQLPQDELGIWHSPGGASVAWLKDPDGNTLSLTEH